MTDRLDDRLDGLMAFLSKVQEQPKVKEPPDFPMPSTNYGDRLSLMSTWAGRGERYSPWDAASKYIPDDQFHQAADAWPGRAMFNYTFPYKNGVSVTLDVRRVSLQVPPDFARSVYVLDERECDQELLHGVDNEWKSVGAKTRILRVDLHHVPADPKMVHHAVVTYLNGFSVEKERA